MKSGMTLKKREFTPESGSVDTYEFDWVCCLTVVSHCFGFVYNIDMKSNFYPADTMLFIQLIRYCLSS